VVKDQSRDAQRIRQLSPSSGRRRLIGGAVIVVVAFAVMIVPHYVSSSPTTNDDTDPTNGVPSATVTNRVAGD
jgi:hypothetical protein